MAECPTCGGSDLETCHVSKIMTGDGTPVEATSYECLTCGWTFIDNRIAGPSPEPQSEVQK